MLNCPEGISNTQASAPRAILDVPSEAKPSTSTWNELNPSTYQPKASTSGASWDESQAQPKASTSRASWDDSQAQPKASTSRASGDESQASTSREWLSAKDESDAVIDLTDFEYDSGLPVDPAPFELRGTFTDICFILLY